MTDRPEASQRNQLMMRDVLLDLSRLSILESRTLLPNIAVG
jgi:hypothetical protein